MNLKKKKRFIRIIPRLDIKNQFLIKGINLEGLRVLGKPYEFAKFYSENGADEIHYSDSVASLYGTNNLRELVKKTAKHLNIPLSIGGGIRNKHLSIEEGKKIKKKWYLRHNCWGGGVDDK